VAFSVLLGVLLAGFGFLLDQWSLKKALREKEREIAALQIELQSYREGQRVIEVKK